MTRDVDFPQGSDTIAEYLGHFGLACEPFSAQDDSLFSRGGFYPGAQRQQTLDQLMHLSQFSSGVLLVLGEAGCGKTALRKAFAAQAESDRIVCSIEAGVLDDQQVLFGQIAESLELPFQNSPGQQLAAIRGHCQDEESADLVVMVDDADDLDDPILSSLLSLLQGVEQDRPGLHLVLFGGPALAERIDAFQMLDVTVHDLSLPALTSDELGDYLECRLRAAGLSGDMPFALKDIEQFWQLSLGLPGAVNRLAHQFLVTEAGMVNQSSERTMGLPLGHMAAVVVLGAVLMMAIVYRYDGESAIDNVKPQEVVSLKVPAQPKPASPVRSAETVEDLLASMGRPVKVDNPQQVVEEASLTEVESTTEIVASGPIASTPPPVDAKPLPEDAVRQADEDVVHVDASSPEESVLGPAEVPTLEEQVAAEELTLLEPAAAAAPTLPADEAFLLQQDETGYVLQVLAAGSEASVQSFVRRQSNRADLKVFEARRNGKPWYVVVVGVYADKADARRAIGQLPSEQRKAGPWPRSVLSVQAEIGEVRDI